MPLTFNLLLQSEGIDPADVRLLRHQTVRAIGRTPYSLWRDQPEQFERYQSTQDPLKRNEFDYPYWASFVVEPVRSGTVFVGLYTVRHAGAVPTGWKDPLTGFTPGWEKGRTYDRYDCTKDARLAAYEGRLYVDWGVGTRSWNQRANSRAGSSKPILQLTRELEEESFPGFTRFIRPLSEIEAMPIGWKEALRATRGIYLLACPRTQQHYVGKASGEDGFLGRWRDYVATGHGGNVELRVRDPSDYYVSVLEVVGTNDLGKLEELETLWKRKLLSRDMGLNRN
jgi:hypothetical protein